MPGCNARSPISMVVNTAVFRLWADQNEGVKSPPPPSSRHLPFRMFPRGGHLLLGKFNVAGHLIPRVRGRGFDRLAVKDLVKLT